MNWYSKLPEDYADKRVVIVGLGYVGLTLAVALADSGFRVHGVEREGAVLACLEQGFAHFTEVGLNERLALQLKRGAFSFSKTLDEAMPASVYIVTVGTPVGDDKRSKFDAIETVSRAIASRLRAKDLIILRSTVRVGTTRKIVEPIFDAAGVDFDLAFCPERTLEGRALAELRSLPQVVGGRDSRSTFRAAQLFSFLTPSVIKVADLETAEMVKLVNNTERDISFAFANEVAAMCDVLGVSAAEVIRSGNLGYPRAHMPLPGPVGGPCLEKDPYILAEGLEGTGFIPSITLSARLWNERLPEWAVEAISREWARKRPGVEPTRISVLGLAFKGRPETSDVRGTLARPLIERLRERFPAAILQGWDPVVASSVVEGLGIRFAPSLEHAFSGADVVVIQNNHQRFEHMDLHVLSGMMSDPGIIYDLWEQHDPRSVDLAGGVTYKALGSVSVVPTPSHYQVSDLQ